MGAIASSLGLGGQGAGFQAQGGPTAAQQAQAAQNTQQGQQQYQQFLQALQASNGVANQSDVYSQLQQVVNGQGPNPAQTMLSQATAGNNANQAALMAGQRGAGANAGLIARQAAQQGAANQQNSAGQAATLQANQSLGALGQAGQLASTQVGEQQGALQGSNQAALQGQQNLIAAQNNANTTNAAVQGAAIGNGGLLGGFLNGAASATGLLGSGAKPLFSLASGGEMPSWNPEGTETGKVMDPSGPKSFVARHLLGLSQGGETSGVNAKVSPGEVRLSRGSAQEVARGANAKSVGETIPGKAKVKGDSLKNDTVSKHLDGGDIIIPRHITQGPDASEKATKFVQAILAKHHMKKGTK